MYLGHYIKICDLKQKTECILMVGKGDTLYLGQGRQRSVMTKKEERQRTMC